MANNNQPITEDDIAHFLDKYVTYGNDNIKALLMNIKKLTISDWTNLIWSKNFRQIFKCKSEIYKKLGNDVKIFEELLIHIPLNYIHWRDGILNGQLFPATCQEGPNSWAHAIATCIVLLKRQIIGSDILTFEDVKTNLLNVFGRKGYHVNDALTNILPQYQLHYRIVPENEVNPFSAYKTYHFYICTFYLNESQWNDFSNFFSNENNIHKILTYNDLNITKDDDAKKFRYIGGGHATVLIDADNYSYTFLNSWGDSWGDHGKFSVARDAIKDMTFYDIYNLESELSEKEKLLLENRRKKSIDAFYQIIDLINILFPDENIAEISKKIENQDLDTVYLKAKLTQLYKEYWKQE